MCHHLIALAKPGALGHTIDIAATTRNRMAGQSGKSLCHARDAHQINRPQVGAEERREMIATNFDGTPLLPGSWPRQSCQ
jgi:hypothetical protein